MNPNTEYVTLGANGELYYENDSLPMRVIAGLLNARASEILYLRKEKEDLKKQLNELKKGQES